MKRTRPLSRIERQIEDAPEPPCTCGHHPLAHARGESGPYAGACLAVVPSGKPDAQGRFTSKPCRCRAFTESEVA